MAIFALAFKSLLNRKLTFLITLFSIAISVTLILGVQSLKNETKTSFMKSISGTDLIVGSRGASSQLLLSSVFHIGNTANTMKYDAYKEISALPAVEWAVPISLGDSHKGYTVMATELSFFDHFSYANKQSLTLKSGQFSDDMFAVVIGADVANKLNYKLGDHVVMTHGGGEIAGHDHDNIPYFVSAILAPSFTAIDQTLIISLEAMEAMHADPHNHFSLFGASSTDTSHDEHAAHDHEHESHDEHAAHEHEHESHDEHAAHDHEHESHDEHAAHEHEHESHEEHAAHDHQHESHDEHVANEHESHDEHATHEHDHEHESHDEQAAHEHESHDEHAAHEHEHESHEEHAAHEHEHESHEEAHHDHASHDTAEQRLARQLKLKPTDINAVFIGLTSRQAVLGMQNYVNNYPNEPLTAIMPAVALQELWSFFSIAEVALNIVTSFVVLVGLLGMLSIILMSLNERRREMAILRSVGARPAHIFALIIGEAAAVCFSGIMLGIVLLYALLFALQAPLANYFGFYLDVNMLTSNDLLILLTIQVSALIIAIIPGLLIYKTSLSDGMSIKF